MSVFMKTRYPGRTVAVLCLGLALGGCANFEMPKFGFGGKKSPASAPAPDPTASVKLIERDVEDPGVFQVTESALWDGRPSLGGVWVAYPGQTQPERVIIRNEENKKFVIGALFKRERDNPGPKIQLSSDAASALGILAGKPTVLNVTALRREQVPQAGATPIAAVADAGTQTDVATIATAAIDNADPAKPKPKAAPVANPRASTLAKPFIQIGIFSIETNANNTAISLRTRGVAPIIKAQESRGKKFWRVIVGPASSVTERAALLKKARGLGFSDAYFVSN